ncbi:hypothetical protein CVU75_01675 [Candidatus Dependentiae bacterium HGW-Dependentiae-1]|nr:MAG: hypothetical protein CVU75_01675 [Candidatus Dependentiae bacterium HGW-Dependentiae-1]
MFLGKKQVLFLCVGVLCSCGLKAAPNEETPLFDETTELLKHVATYGVTVAPTAIQVTLPYLIASTDLAAVPHSRQHAVLEAVGSYALWVGFKQCFARATGSPCAIPAYNASGLKSGSKKEMAAQGLNAAIRVTNVALDLAGPMLIRGIIAGANREGRNRQR